MKNNEFNRKRIAILPWPDKPDCYLCVSGAMKRKERYGDKWYLNNHDERVKKFSSSYDACEAKITFAYKGKSVAAEWDGEHGPIQIWYKCDENYTDGYEIARQHWLFDYAYGNGHWSQMAVDENNLVESFNRGDYENIFLVLKEFVDSRENKE